MRTPPDMFFVQPILRLAIGALVAIGMLSIGSWPAAAQDSASRKPAAANTATKKPSAGKAVRSPVARRAPQSDPHEEKPAFEFSPDPSFSSATSRPFLTGDEWQDTLLRFEQWLSIQTLYDAEQVQRMRTKFAERVKTTSTVDRKQFINEIDAKLQILYSRGTIELQDYFTEGLSMASPAYVKKTRQPLPDVVGSTPEQLKERLASIALRHQSSVEVHQAFEQMRQLKIASDEEKTEARPSAGHIASSSASTNQQRNKGYTKARDYFPQSGHSISYSVIPAMPMMTNSGWAMFGGGVAITIQRNR
jgi:hypothetical protein